MKVLLLGAGQVATAVRLTAPSSHELIARTRSALDIVDAQAVEHTIADLKPDWIVNAAAYTAVDLAEDQPAQAEAVNDTAVGTLARAATRSGSRLLHLSTDFVFNGQSSRAYLPGDATQPLSVYGATKLGGERHVISSSEGIVLRTSWVYASTGKNFVLTMLRLMREKPAISVVSDQIGAPTWATSCAHAIWGLLNANAAPGIYHWTDLGVASWYDFAVAVQEESLTLGLLTGEIPIVPISSAQYPARAVRPAFSLLDTSATRSLIKIASYHWRHNLRNMLGELRAA